MATAAPAAGSASDEAPVAPVGTFNNDHNAHMQAIIAEVLAHEIFQDVADHKPLDINDGGSEAAFTVEFFKQAVEGPAKAYKCAANLCWMCMAADYDWPVNTT